MICNVCRGSGRRLNPRLCTERASDGSMRVLERPWREPLLVPCDECTGGIASCCDTAGLLDLFDIDE